MSEVLFRRLDPAFQESGGFRWGRAGTDFVAEWADVLTIRANARGELVGIETARGARAEVVDKIRNGAAAAFLRAVAGGHSLHASTVAIHGGAALFAGPSGAGKSTLAACMCAVADAQLLADDVAGLELAGAEWHVVPSESAFWLQGNGVEGKLPVPYAGRPSRAAPLRWAFSLCFDDRLVEPTIRRLSGTDAAGVLVGAVMRFEATPAVWKREFDLVGTLVEQAAVWQVARSRAVDAETVARVALRSLLDEVP